MTFAALETAINTAVAGLLANATAVFCDGAEVDMVFRERQQPTEAGQVAGSFRREWQLECPRSAFAEAPPGRGDTVSVGGVDYVVGWVDTDATGWTTLVVSRA